MEIFVEDIFILNFQKQPELKIYSVPLWQK